MPGASKTSVLPHLEDRVRAHIRAAMVENKLGLTAFAERIGEDKGALSAMLNDGRAPNLWVVYRLQVVFNIPAHSLLNEDPPSEHFKPGVPAPDERRYALRQGDAGPPSDASREAAHPGKRRRNAGGGT